LGAPPTQLLHKCQQKQNKKKERKKERGKEKKRTKKENKKNLEISCKRKPSVQKWF
jgi:hypothetical protein